MSWKQVPGRRQQQILEVRRRELFSSWWRVLFYIVLYEKGLLDVFSTCARWPETNSSNHASRLTSRSRFLTPFTPVRSPILFFSIVEVKRYGKNVLRKGGNYFEGEKQSNLCYVICLSISPSFFSTTIRKKSARDFDSQ